MKARYGWEVLADYNIMFRKKMHFGQLSLKKAHLFISCVSLNCVRAKYGLDLPEEEYSVFGKIQELAHLTGGEADLGHAILLGHQLGGHAGGADQLGTLAGVELDVVDHLTHGDVGDGQAVARQDVGVGGVQRTIARIQG